jgi:endonuclease III
MAGVRDPSVIRRPRARGRRVAERLVEVYPDVAVPLRHESAFQLLAATILSAQTTDVGVNRVTPVLFARYPDAAAMAAAEPAEVEAIIHPTGFFRAKTRSLIGMARAVEERFGGEVPGTVEELVTLPGVGRKTANVVLGHWFGTPGVTVDTHVLRVSRRLLLTRESDPVRVERDLAAVWPRRLWSAASMAMIIHGRRVCTARRPACPTCPLADLCPSAATLGVPPA